MKSPSMELSLVKLHGLGNDFLVLLDDSAGGSAPALRRDPDAGLARRLCDRRRGIGADGLVLGRRLGNARGGGGADDAPGAAVMTFTIWNADGGEAEMSGNGLRCLAHAALDRGWVADGRPFGVLTPAGRREVSVRRTGQDRACAWSTVEMGAVKVRGEYRRCNVGHGQLLVDVGNPHLVVLGPDPGGVDVERLGPLLERSEPSGMNVEFVALGPGIDNCTMRVWERGVGETLACGTGACAVAMALHHWGRVGRFVTVHQPGGPVAVELRKDGSAMLSGPSQRVAECRVSADW